jgi:glutamate racemase
LHLTLLEENQKPGQNIILLPCPGLADVIEKYLTIDSSKIVDKLTELLAGVPMPDVVVLGCTHYSLIKDYIQDLFPNAKLLDGNFGIACRLKQLLDVVI